MDATTIKAAREALGLTFTDFAALMCVSYQTAWRWEASAHVMPPIAERFLVNIFKVPALRKQLGLPQTVVTPPGLQETSDEPEAKPIARFKR